VRTLAFLVALALAGCLQPSPAADVVSACPGFAACVFTASGPITVVVHLSPGATAPAAGLAELAAQVEVLAARPIAVANGTVLPPLPAVVDDGALSALHAGGPDGLHIYVVDAVRLEGDAPSSGLSFPGSSAVFLFPATMDQRVAEAGLPEGDRARVRATLEAVVLVHEFGHALGLVGCGIPMQAEHADPASSCHSSNASSVMHSRVARVAQWPASDPAAGLGPFAWDGDDLADLAAFRAALA
jgi:hypothetical protein